MVDSDHVEGVMAKAIQLLKTFYTENTHIKESHGFQHAMAVYHHSVKALHCCPQMIQPWEEEEIALASLLHDVDDRKYFPQTARPYENARNIMKELDRAPESINRVVLMIDWVSCSKNGNHVPDFIRSSGNYHLLIPRWSDRLEAVGRQGVYRCYQYTLEHQQALHSAGSPRATSVEQVWELATPERFERYQSSGGHSSDMISHYYDKLLHVARPPPESVRNPYLEDQARESVDPLLEVCIRFGVSGQVDEEYLASLKDS